MATWNMTNLPPYFDSQRSAAATLGIDIFELRKAKAEGCPAFRSGRVYTAPLLAWLAEKRQRRAELAAAKTVDGVSDLDLASSSEKDAELPKSLSITSTPKLALALESRAYQYAPPLQPRINPISRIVATIETNKDPTHPSRVEKNANTVQQS